MGDAPPPDKESKQVDAAGKRAAVGMATHWCITSSVGLLFRYDMAHWKEMKGPLQHRPEQYLKRGKELEQGKVISNDTIRCALESVDTAAR